MKLSKYLLFIIFINFLFIPITYSDDFYIDISKLDKYSTIIEDLDIQLNRSIFPNWILAQTTQPKLINFTNLSPIKIDNDSYIFRAEIVVDFQFGIASSISINDFNLLHNSYEERWGLFIYCDDLTRMKPIEWDGVSYNIQDYLGISANPWILGGLDRNGYILFGLAQLNSITSISSFYNFNKDICINIDFTFKDAEINFGTDIYRIKNNIFTTRLASAQIVDTLNYEYQISEDILDDKISILNLNAVLNSANEAKDILTNEINSKQLGIFSIQNIETEINNGKSILAPLGSNCESDNKSKIFLYNIEINPKIIEYKNLYQINYAEYGVDTTSGVSFSPAGLIGPKNPKTISKSRVYGCK